jgi:hypothetical protein
MLFQSSSLALSSPIIVRILCLVFIATHIAHSDFQAVAGYSWGAQHNCRLNIVDTDRDSLYEMIFLSRIALYTQAIWFYEQTSGNPFQFQLVDSIMISNDTLTFFPWVIDDADCDGLYDMIGNWASMIGGPPIYGNRVYESSDSFSFPKHEVWRDTVQYGAMSPKSAFDIDQDGFIEYINSHAGPPNSVRLYEAIGDNQYDTVFTCTPGGGTGPYSSYAFGDFDLDGAVEFAMGSLNGTYWIYESPGNNQYDRLLQSNLPTNNIYDCFAVADADGDGRMEFVIKGYVWGTRFDVFIFEATNDNTYEIIASFQRPPSGYEMCYSDVGDVDGDGTLEIVVACGIAACVIKAAGNDTFYVFDNIYGGQNIRVVDLDRDGDCEIIASGLDHTEIYQYVPPGIVEDVGRNVSESMLRVSPSPCGDVLNIVFRCVEGNARIRVFDIKGTEVIAENVYEDYESVKLDIRYFVPGVYFVQLESSKHSETKKIIILK